MQMELMVLSKQYLLQSLHFSSTVDAIMGPSVRIVTSLNIFAAINIWTDHASSINSLVENFTKRDRFGNTTIIISWTVMTTYSMAETTRSALELSQKSLGSTKIHLSHTWADWKLEKDISNLENAYKNKP